MAYALRQRRTPSTSMDVDDDNDGSSDEDYVVNDVDNANAEDSASEQGDDIEEPALSDCESDDEEQGAGQVGFHIEETQGVMRGKDGTPWSSKPTTGRGRPLAQNIVIRLPGPKGPARQVTTPLQAWKLLFPDKLIDKVVEHTNRQISLAPINQRYGGPTDRNEIHALLGILYLAGVHKAGKRNAPDLWDMAWSGTFYRCAMNVKRFQYLMVVLRFDDRSSREQREESEGRMSPIYEVFNEVNQNCQLFYSPSAHVTVDEQLLAFRGRCKFRVYMPAKPDKYGIEVVALCDAKTFYRYNAILYLGKGSTPTGVPQAEYFVKKLVEPLFGSNRNVTMDNRFTSRVLFQQLRDKRLTAVGTIRKNRRELPPAMVDVKPRQLNSVMFSSADQMTLLSFCPPKKSPKKVVLLLSSMHAEHDSHQFAATNRKPTIIEYYNKTKGGVDSHDQLSHAYSTIRATNRWPLLVFFGLLDTAGINAAILLRMSTGVTVPRRHFLQDLAKSLARPHMESRLPIPQTPRIVRQMIRDMLGLAEDPAPRGEADGTKRRCLDCPRRLDRKTRERCNACAKAICGEHSVKVCGECAQN